jgi:hypothetical protein
MNVSESTVIIHGVEYIKKDDALLSNFESPELLKCFVGKWVIVRSYNEGINFGKVKALDETAVVIEHARRLWGHKPQDKNMSWYEGVALSGLSDDCAISETVPIKGIVENYSLTLVSDVAVNSIRGLKGHAQT